MYLISFIGSSYICECLHWHTHVGVVYLHNIVEFLFLVGVVFGISIRVSCFDFLFIICYHLADDLIICLLNWFIRREKSSNTLLGQNIWHVYCMIEESKTIMLLGFE